MHENEISSPENTRSRKFAISFIGASAIAALGSPIVAAVDHECTMVSTTLNQHLAISAGVFIASFLAIYNRY